MLTMLFSKMCLDHWSVASTAISTVCCLGNRKILSNWRK